MRTSSRLGALTWVLICLATAAVAGGEPRYRSVQEAQDQGISAFGSGYYDMAIDPLEYAAAHNDFLAQYYLARIYSDTAGPRADQAKAYVLYQHLADAHADIDPDYDRRAPFVAKTLTALAGYLTSGISEIGLAPDPSRAAEYLHHAATFFNDEDAQFHLAKLIVEGSLRRTGQSRDLPREKLAIHWLSVLTTEKRHASAQAVLAYLMWRGEHEPLVRKDAQRALALVIVAAENAPASDRIWIEDYYQEIYCGSPAANRKKIDGMLASYRQQFGPQPNARPLDRRERSGLGGLHAETARSCSNNEIVPAIKRHAQGLGAAGAPAREATQPFARGAATVTPTPGIMDAAALGRH